MLVGMLGSKDHQAAIPPMAKVSVPVTTLPVTAQGVSPAKILKLEAQGEQQLRQLSLVACNQAQKAFQWVGQGGGGVGWGGIGGGGVLRRSAWEGA